MAVAVVLLLVVIGDCVLSVTSSQSYSSVELPVSMRLPVYRLCLAAKQHGVHKYVLLAFSIIVFSSRPTCDFSAPFQPPK